MPDDDRERLEGLFRSLAAGGAIAVIGALVVGGFLLLALVHWFLSGDPGGSGAR